MKRIGFLARSRVHKALTLAGLLALSLPVCLPLLGRQIPAGGDTLMYAPRLVEFHENLIHGVVLPRWAPDLGNGHGQPLFLFVPPLTYYFGEVWRLAGLDAAKALDAVAASAVFVAAASMFLLGRLLWNKWAGWLAAAAYLYAPYFHVNLYVLHHIAEFVAFAFYPIAIYGLAVFARSRDVRYLGLAVLGHAAVVLTHNGAALMFTPVFVAFLFFQSWQFRSLRLLSWQAAALVLSLTLTAFQWIPSLLEKRYVHLDRTIRDYFDYRAHFVIPWQLFSSHWGYRGSSVGDTDGMSFSLGWSHVLLAGIAVVLALRRSRDGRTTWFFAVMAILASYMTLLKSSSVAWAYIELLKYLQFPWRFLAISAFTLALVVGSLVSMSAASPWLRRATFVAAMLLLIVPNLSHAAPEFYTEWNPSDWSSRELARREIETTTSAEYEPVWVQKTPSFAKEKLQFVSGNGEIEDTECAPTTWRAKIHAHTDTVIEAALFYFPGWTLTVDGKEAPIHWESSGGRIQFSLPAGDHTVGLKFKNTTTRLVSSLLSLAGLLAVPVLWLIPRRRYAKGCSLDKTVGRNSATVG